MKNRFARYALLLCLATISAAATAQPPPGPPPAGSFVVHAIDVGTGLAIFVEGNDFTLLYDAGSNDDDARGRESRVDYLRQCDDLRSLDHSCSAHAQDHVELMRTARTFACDLWIRRAEIFCSYELLLSTVARRVTYHDAVADGGTRTAPFAGQTCYGRPIAAATASVPRGSQARRGTTVLLGQLAHMTFLNADGSRQASFNANSVVVRLTLGTRVILFRDAEAGAAAPRPRPHRDHRGP